MTRTREGRPEDLPHLRAIQQAALAESWPELLETAVDGPPALYVLTDGSLIGYALVVGESDGVAYVPEFAIHPDEQGQGLGSHLMEWLCDRLSTEGYEELRLTARADDERVRSFYRDHGFRQLERLDDHFDSGDGLLLTRPLDARK